MGRWDYDEEWRSSARTDARFPCWLVRPYLPLLHPSLSQSLSQSNKDPGLIIRSPDIIERIEGFLDSAHELRGEETKGRTLDCNQVLINEYQADQGISVSLSSTQAPTTPM